ncbi:methyltransferase domain-containing protein [Halostreptopolyspora alba]|uniref:Protein-L-isoaspartate O-methyltransferase n=1 Tax=Halostreptopolyspora alba TaxID=2487137 RepID=A0A3N0E8K0_9ACTN|nr:methyltransferase domain-containing protein [Nocardiopsaceae bacterium YIM 96095]
MTTTEEHQARLAEELPAAWRSVFHAVPRHVFLPGKIWVRGESDGQPIALDRRTAPDAWLEACYRDAPVAVQLDDGGPGGSGYVSSTASMPSVVATMLEAAELSEGQRVLEIGTGTGFNAALIARLVGAGNVTTVEIDADLAEGARAALAEAGCSSVATVVGDGENGYSPGGPYDRVIATAAVQRIPYPWVEQTRPGGRILTPFGTAFHSGALLHLHVADDGTASGRFGGDTAFMWVRGQRPSHGAVEDRVLAEHEYTETTTSLHPYEPVGDFDASFAIGLGVPGMRSTVVHDHDDPATGRFTVYLMDADSGSWASWRVTPERSGGYRVCQHGARALFDELSAAHTWWRRAGRPEHTRFGLTVTPDGQRIWIDEPGQVVSGG